ncbi:HI0074 family nucleotidyltransferase substrate-binding subunit [Endozoicomonas numazuensis]|uniref:HI0074 family nucleotidyltransferase substrate-binding subunit n=1 Tax=Endozoicomonas numazuensis TaxID=1137799 RepID=UPI00068D85E2|nr:HI0074 family nucleotidyltransferase substrate-binding subunit [Endozoicomonas numazuensis]
MTLDTTGITQALTPLNNALELLDETASDNERLRLALQDSVVQRFEYTYEMSWKLMKRWISDNVSPEDSEPGWSRRELYRLAAKTGLIAEPKRWFAYHEARNVSSHTYHKASAAKVMAVVREFATDTACLVQVINEQEPS